MTSPRSGYTDSRPSPEQGTGFWEDAVQTPRSPLTPEYPLNDIDEPHTRRRERGRVSGGTVLARILVPIYLLMIAAAVLLPDPVTIHAVKEWIGELIQSAGARIARSSSVKLGDVASNIAAFIPLTLLLGLAWRRVPTWVWGLTGTLLSVAAETAQYLIPELTRRPDVWNVIENSIGSWVGSLLVALIPKALSPDNHRDHLT